MRSARVQADSHRRSAYSVAALAIGKVLCLIVFVWALPRPRKASRKSKTKISAEMTE